MRRSILALTALLTLGMSAPQTAPAGDDDYTLCRIYCEVWYLGCLATGGRIDETLCDEWYAGCKDGCRVDVEPR